MKADDIQVGGDHYQKLSIQPWAAMASWMTAQQFRGFLRGNAIKYLARCDDKGEVEDLKKARHYLDKLIETYTAGHAPNAVADEMSPAAMVRVRKS